jgi:hypothetical protein
MEFSSFFKQALLVIDYLLRNGSERVITECRARIIEIKTLMEFQRVTRYDKDVGLSGIYYIYTRT